MSMSGVTIEPYEFSALHLIEAEWTEPEYLEAENGWKVKVVLSEEMVSRSSRWVEEVAPAPFKWLKDVEVGEYHVIV